MAAGRPWYQRNGGEFILGTVHMDLETRGAYSVIIDLLNDRDRPIPDEPRFIAGILNCSVRKWGEIRKRLLSEGKLAINEHGELTNPRFEREHMSRAEARDRAVELGREGGRKSAALRAAGQTELPLKNAELSIYRADKSIKKAARVKDKSEHKASPTKKTNHLDQGPPQATRARESPETRESIRSNSEPSARPRARARKPQPERMLTIVIRASGFNPTAAGHRAKALEFVQAWLELGIDIEGLAVPIIERIIADAPDKTTGSLARFDKQIRAEHAAQAAARKHPPPPSPAQIPKVLGGDDPDPRLAQIRADLRRDYGTRTYDGWLMPMRLTVDGTALIILMPSTFMADWVQTHFSERLRTEAKRHGFTEVRIKVGEAAKPP